MELGIARELTKPRNRVFAYDRYLAILSEGTAAMSGDGNGGRARPGGRI